MIVNDLVNPGYYIFNVENKGPLEKIRAAISTFLNKKIPGLKLQSTDLHTFDFAAVSENNQLRKELMGFLIEKEGVSELVWECVKNQIINVFGPDVLAQRRVNIVIQSPNAVDNAPLHRDAPPHSRFDLVAWIPLVDVYETNSMYVCSVEQSRQMAKLLEENATTDFYEFFQKKAVPLNMNFGQAVIFSPEIFHGPKINKTKDTRWAINTRYRGLFYPSGAKGVPDYFKVQNLSPFSNHVLGSKND